MPLSSGSLTSKMLCVSMRISPMMAPASSSSAKEGTFGCAAAGAATAMHRQASQRVSRGFTCTRGDYRRGAKTKRARPLAVPSVLLLRVAIRRRRHVVWPLGAANSGMAGVRACVEAALRAAFAVAGIEPQRQRLAPGALAGFAKAQRTTARSRICGRCPVDAERFESGDYARLGAERRQRSGQRDVDEKVAHIRPRMAQRPAMHPPRSLRRGALAL